MNLRFASMLLLALLITGCGTIPTVTPSPTSTPQMTVTVPPIATVAPTRTPLPTVTPLGGIASNTPRSVTNAPASTAGLVAPSSQPVQLTQPAGPTSTSALIAQASATALVGSPSATFTPVSIQPGSAPPFVITLPTGWRTTYTLIPISDVSGTSTMNLAAYAGPIAGGTGTGFIFVLWNFPSMIPINPAALPTTVKDAQEQSTLADGYRLLRGSILDESCLVNVYGRNYFRVGVRDGIGNLFQTAGCQDNRPDILGWYTGVWEGGRQFLFFAYVEPFTVFNNAQAELQIILASVRFDPNRINNPSGAVSTITPGVPLSATPLIAATPTPPKPTVTPELS